MPLQNRVTPAGEIVSDPGRGHAGRAADPAGDSRGNRGRLPAHAASQRPGAPCLAPPSPAGAGRAGCAPSL